MKSQERHELETNALAKFLATWAERIGPYSSHLLFGVLALVAVVAIWQLSKSAWSSRSAEGWDRVTAAIMEQRPDLDVLKVAGEEYSKSLEGQLAKLLVADSELNNASVEFLANKELAMTSLGTAERLYDELVKQGRDPLVIERAKFGQARVLEIKGKIPEAIEAYESLGGTFAQLGKTRAEFLAKIPAEEYSTWLFDAQGSIPRRSLGLGGPMDFGADPLHMPEGQPPVSGPLFGDEFLRELEATQQQTPEAPRPDRYEESTQEPQQEPLGEGEQPAEGGLPTDQPPAAEPPAAESTPSAEPAVEAPAETPAGEQPATEPPAS